MIVHYCLIIHIISRMLCKDFFSVITREMAKWKIFFLVLRLQSRALWCSQAQRPFWFPFLKDRPAASMTFCEFQRAEQMLIKEGCSHWGNVPTLVTQWTQNWLPFLPLGDLSNPGIEPKSPVLAGGFLGREDPLEEEMATYFVSIGLQKSWT